MKKMMWLAMICAVVFALAACGPTRNSSVEPNDGLKQGTDKPDTEATEEEPGKAETSAGVGEEEEKNKHYEKEITVELKNSDGQQVGTAMLSEEKNGVKVKVEASDMPAGKHGFHFHENGVCEGPDYKSAGDHFNPEDKEHGLENEKGSHAGDMPNIKVNEDGKISEEIIAEGVTLEKNKPNSLLKEGGTALVIHAEEDDGRSQPAGDAGDRLVCGVIE